MARMVEITCGHCGTKRLRPVGQVNRAKRKGQKMFCSRRCSAGRTASRPHQSPSPRPEAPPINLQASARTIGHPLRSNTHCLVYHLREDRSRGKEFPLVGLVVDDQGNKELVRWTRDGFYATGRRYHPFNLVQLRDTNGETHGKDDR